MATMRAAKNSSLTWISLKKEKKKVLPRPKPSVTLTNKASISVQENMISMSNWAVRCPVPTTHGRTSRRFFCALFHLCSILKLFSLFAFTWGRVPLTSISTILLPQSSNSWGHRLPLPGLGLSSVERGSCHQKSLRAISQPPVYKGTIS